MKPRPRKQRPSEDIARDALVEQVLHEHGLGVYDAPAEGSSQSAQQGGDADTDERFAEQFRKDFMDALAERQQKQKAPSQSKAPGAGDVQKGPRLGGGRSARAKMAAAQQQQAQSQSSGTKK